MIPRIWYNYHLCFADEETEVRNSPKVMQLYTTIPLFEWISYPSTRNRELGLFVDHLTGIYFSEIKH